MRQAGLLNICSKLGRNQFAAGLAVLLLLALQALAASPHLHHLLHEDSHQPDHQCAVKLLSDGMVDLEPGLVFLVQPRAESAPASVRETIILSAPDHQFPPGRAPPVSLP